MKITLLKYLVNADAGSRRACFSLIQKGQVKVNKKVVLQPLHLLEDKDIILLDDQPVKLKKETIEPVYIMMNKPQKYVCSVKDEKNKPSILKLIKHKQIIKKHIFPVGRLDFLTEGLIFITNDGHFSNHILQAKNRVLKCYLVEIKGHIRESDINKIRRGIYTKECKYQVEDIKLLSANKKSSKLRLKLIEGKNREIRNIFAILKFKVRHLKRTQIGAFKLDRKLLPGEYKLISKKDIYSKFKIKLSLGE